MQWDKIDSWMRQRSFDVFAPGVIVHPTLGMSSHHTQSLPSIDNDVGEAYPGGKGDNIGIALDHLMSDHE